MSVLEVIGLIWVILTSSMASVLVFWLAYQGIRKIVVVVPVVSRDQREEIINEFLSKAVDIRTD